MLMLGGARDEVVPRSQMQELWTIVRSRGCDAEGRKKPRTSGVPGAASENARAEAEVGEFDEPGPDDPKVPPRVFKDGVNTYVEFGAGTHSKFSLSFSYLWFVRAEFSRSR
jgi:hypothetical protein